VSKPSSAVVVRIDPGLLTRLHAKAQAVRWGVSEPVLAIALQRSAVKALADGVHDASRLERHLNALHLEDLALACACAGGHEAAWDHFVREYRPVLYRAAEALAPGGGAREIADSIYAELYGLQERDGARRSLFQYFHGRSSLATWLRAVLAQRHVDGIRSSRRLTPLEGDDSLPEPAARAHGTDPDKARLAAAIKLALLRAVAHLVDRDRLRLACYYRESLTLAETGRLLGEHEATVSRQLAKTRRAIRADVEQYLRREHGFGEDEIRECFASSLDDAGTIDLGEMLNSSAGRKESEPERSM
jgi:RNA polymerase sigma-70 factor, ECF subfamily